MDNGTLMMNAISYSGNGGTLVMNGKIYSGTGGEGGTDVSDTTATQADVLSGKIFHTADGSSAVGTLVMPRILENNSPSYTASGSAVKWKKYGEIDDIEISSDGTNITCNFAGNYNLLVAAMQRTNSSYIQLYKNNSLVEEKEISTDRGCIITFENVDITNGTMISIKKKNDNRGYLHVSALYFMKKE